MQKHEELPLGDARTEALSPAYTDQAKLASSLERLSAKARWMSELEDDPHWNEELTDALVACYELLQIMSAEQQKDVNYHFDGHGEELYKRALNTDSLYNEAMKTLERFEEKFFGIGNQSWLEQKSGRSVTAAHLAHAPKIERHRTSLELLGESIEAHKTKPSAERSYNDREARGHR